MSTHHKANWRVVTPATWPAPPAEMSLSVCVEIEECPRRWALSAADYPEVWGGRGYPPKLQVAAVAGSVVHLALEIILHQLVGAGVPSISDPSAPQVLRKIGGYTRVLEESIERVLECYVDNPRADGVIEYAQRALRGQIPALRSRVQSMLSRVRLPKNFPSAPVAVAPKVDRPLRRLPLGSGIYPEVEVRAKGIGWKGRVDLITLGDDACEITDFKTGDIEEAHKVQVRAYAVMWGLDDELNPSGRAVDRLLLSYSGQTVNVPPPSTLETDKIIHELLNRRRAAEAALTACPPLARPSAESCRYCSVRQLCDAYWSGGMQNVSECGRFGDIELKVTGRHGPTSWDAVVERARDYSRGTPVLLRVASSDVMAVGGRVRVLNGQLVRDDESGDVALIVSLGVLSEAFHVPRA